MKKANRILIFCFLASFFYLASAQEFTQEEKQEIIANLDSSAFHLRFQSIKLILEFQLPEAVTKVEENFWNQESELCTYFLRALKKYDSPLFSNLAHSLIDSIDYIRVKYPPNDPLKIKVEITGLLFEENDYSTTQYIFQLIERDKPRVNFESLYLLDKVIENVPGYELLAKNELIRASKQYHDKVNSSFALAKLINVFGQESLQDLVDIFINHSDSAVRRYALKYIQEYHYQDLNNLLKSRFISDEMLSADLSYYLLKYFGQPSDVQFVLDNLQFVNDSLTYSSIKAYYNSYEPAPPQNYSTLLEYIGYSNSLCDTLYVYNWLGDQQFQDELQSILQSAKTNLQAGDSVVCAIQVKSFQDEVDYVYKDSLNADPRFVTLEGWKFLYWNAQYILDRLPTPSVVTELELNEITPAMSMKNNPGAFTMELWGSGFSSSSVVYFNGNARATTYVSDSTITAAILATDVTTVGNFPVWVSNSTTNSDTLVFKVVNNLPKEILPIMNCVTNNGNGTYTAYFGYNNKNSVSVFVPVYAQNKISPDPWDRGQPGVFKVGIQERVFSVTWSSGNIIWHLNNKIATAKRTSPPCP